MCGNCQTNQQNGEIFEPPYLFNSDGTLADRPVITETSETVAPGDTMVVSGSDDIAAFSMIRLAALTHHHSTDQRRIPVQFDKTGAGAYELSLPANPSVLIPGNYWLFALNADGVPSEGYSVQVQVVEDNIVGISDLNTNTALLTYEYFEPAGQTIWNALPDFDALTPVATGFATSFSLTQALREDHFGFRYEGHFDIAEAGDYMFFLASDDGSHLYINDQLVINHDGIHGPTEEIGELFLGAGQHTLRVDYFEADRGNVLRVDIEGDTVPRQSIAALLLPIAEAASGAQTLVQYEYYEGNWNTLPDFDALVPVKAGVQGDFSIAPADSNDNFAFRYTTQLFAETAGDYTFFTSSDDGSQLFVNGTLVVNNDGLHPPVESSGTINLGTGWHDIVVTFFEKSGGESLDVDIQRPAGSRVAFNTYAQGSNATSGANNANNSTNNTGNNTNDNNTNGNNPNPVAYEYYEGSWNALPNFDALVAVQTGNIATVSLQPALQDDFFGMRFTFDIEIATAGQYTFHSSSDDGSQVWVNGQLVVNNDGLHALKDVAGATTLAAGMHQVVVTYFEKGGQQGLEVDVTSPAGLRSGINNYLPQPANAAPAAPIVGVEYDYYEGNWTKVPNFDVLQPLDSGTLTDIDLSPATAADNFAMRFNTSLQIETAGVYTFHLTSDDGSLLHIDDQLVVDNDGLHAVTEESGSMVLAVGLHNVTVSFLERTGLQTLTAEVTDPSGVRQPLSSLFFDGPIPDAAAADPEPVPDEPAAALPVNLISNGDFENDLVDWENCGVEASSNVLDVVTGGSQLMLDNGGCRFQEIPVDVGDTLILTCDASNDGSGFSSFALTLQDDAFVSLLTSEVPIPAGGLQAQSTALVAPLGISTAVVTFYSEAVSGFDNCSLTRN